MFTQCKNIKIVNKLIHNVVTLHPQVTLTVDGQHKERWSAPAPFPLLSSSQVNRCKYFSPSKYFCQVWVGGAPADLHTRPAARQRQRGMFGHHKHGDLPPNFVGCLKKVGC